MEVITKLKAEINNISKQICATRDESQKAALRQLYRTKYYQLKVQRLIVFG